LSSSQYRSKYVPRVVVTDTLKSYDAAKRELLLGVEHYQDRYLNNHHARDRGPEAGPRLTTILPDLTPAEALDTTRVHRVAGRMAAPRRRHRRAVLCLLTG
jgi:hypothetical protein